MSDTTERLNAAADKAAELEVELRLLARAGAPVEPEKPDEPKPEPERPPPVPGGPHAALVARFTHAVQGLTVNVDRTTSTRPPGGGESKWDFGDGTVRLGKARDSHTYKAPGTYPITLELNAFAHAGLTHSVTHNVTVAGEAEDPTDPELPTVDPPDDEEPEFPPDPTDDEDDPTAPPVPPTQPPTGPTPSPTPQDTPNEPVGFRIITDRHFRTKHPAYGYGSLPRYATGMDASLAEGWSNVEGKHAGFSIVDDSTVPSGDGKAGQMRYPAGMRSGVGPATVTMQFPPRLTEAYMAIWMKLSKNLVGNMGSTNKMFFVGIGNGNNQFFLSAEGRETGRLEPQIRLQGVLDPRRRIRPNISPASVIRGQWQLFEFLLVGNSGLSVPDGTIDLWVDGQHATHADKVNWTQGAHPAVPFSVNMFTWNPTYGGGGAGVPFNDKDYQWDSTNPKTFTRSRKYILAMSKLPVSQRPQQDPEKHYPSPAPEFAIDPNDEAQYQWFDRVYVSAR